MDETKPALVEKASQLCANEKQENKGARKEKAKENQKKKKRKKKKTKQASQTQNTNTPWDKGGKTNK